LISHQIEQASDRPADGPQRVFDHLLPRDVWRHPWGGTLVQAPGALPSGYYPARDRPGPDGKGYRDNPADEHSGGNAGIVGRDHQLLG